jgi:hypothetical protein
MSKLSRDKGARIEREIVVAHVGLGIKAERVPLSGASRYQGNGSDPDPKAYAACSLAAERPLSKPITAARVLAAGTGLHAPHRPFAIPIRIGSIGSKLPVPG